MRIANRLAALSIDAALLVVLLIAMGFLLGSTTPGMRLVGIAVAVVAFAQALRIAVRVAPMITAAIAREA